MRSKGFTLLEMMIVVVILGILAAIALPRYFKIVEKGRTSEARTILGQILDAERVYYFDQGQYTTSLSDLSIDVPTTCNASHYFNYTITGGGASFTATARRCTSGGKDPDCADNYGISINNSGGMAYTASPSFVF